MSNFEFLACEHFACRQCLHKIVEMAVSEYDLRLIKCPNLNCLRPIAEISQIIESNQWDELGLRYSKIKADFAIILNRKTVFCPNTECKKLIAKSRKQKSSIFLLCPFCRLKFCQECQLPSHPNRICPSSAANDGLKTLKRKRLILCCPQCETPIEKSSGCNQIVCKFCKHNFCWLCGKSLTKYHYDFYNIIWGCPGLRYSHAINGFNITMRRYVHSLFVLTLISFLLLLVCYFKRQVYFLVKIGPGLALACFALKISNVVFRRIVFFAINICAYYISNYLLVSMGLWILSFAVLKMRSRNTENRPKLLWEEQGS